MASAEGRTAPTMAGSVDLAVNGLLTRLGMFLPATVRGGVAAVVRIASPTNLLFVGLAVLVVTAFLFASGRRSGALARFMSGESNSGH